MIITETVINGTTYLCVVTPFEKSRLDKGAYVTIPVERRTPKRLGVPRGIQLAQAGIAAPPVVF